MGNKRVWLAALLLLTFLLSAIWAVVIPTTWGNFQPDEGSHIAVVRFMATHRGAIPPYYPPYDTAVHPPLYHALAAFLYAQFLSVLGPSQAVVAIRLFGALIGTGTVYAVYLMARQIALCRAIAFPIAVLIALIPMRVSLSGGVTNENLAALGASATLVVLYAAIRRGFTLRRVLWLSLWAVVAIGSKITCLGLLPAIAVGAVLARKPNQAWWRSVIPVLLPVVAVLLALGWWFVYNTVHYGDPLRKAAADRLWNGLQPGFAAISDRTGMPAWRYLVSILGWGWCSFWGQFDGMRYRMPTGVYAVLFATQLISFWGIVIGLRRYFPLSRTRLAMSASTVVLAAWVLLIYLQYNWLHFTPQGRYFFVLLGPLTLFLAGGLQLFLRRYLPDPRHQRWVWSAFGLFLLLLNVYALWVMPRLRFES